MTDQLLNKLFKEELSADQFLWDMWSSNMGENMITVFDSDNFYGICNPKYAILGWCRGHRLPVRSRADHVAVMFWNKKEKHEFWLHCHPDFVDTLANKLELKEKKSCQTKSKK